jgi:hypothetical protein
LNDSRDAYAAEVAVKEKAAKRRVRRFAYAAGLFALLAIFATGAAGFARIQWKRANTAFVAANEATQKAEAARQRAVVAEAQAQRQLGETIVAKDETEKQRQLAQAAEHTAVEAKAEAVSQRDAAQKSAHRTRSQVGKKR